MSNNVSDQYFEPSTDTDANFANSVSGQTNSYFLPAVYSKKVLNFFRKSSVAEAITNTDYAGEITAYGDTVRIIKEPVITVYQYERGQDVTQTKLTDQEINLVVDTANAFKFIVDDIETSMSHVNFKEVAFLKILASLNSLLNFLVILTPSFLLTSHYFKFNPHVKDSTFKITTTRFTLLDLLGTPASKLRLLPDVTE